MEVERASLYIAKESAKVKEKESETEKQLEMIRAETKAAISKINSEKEILMKNGSMKAAEIENTI